MGPTRKGFETKQNAEGSRATGAPGLSRSRLSIRHAFELDPLLTDGLLAFALVVLGVVGLLAAMEEELAPTAAAPPTALVAVLVMFQTTPITWRRRSPIAVLVVVELATLAYHLLHYPFTGADLGALVAFYTVASRYDARVVLASAAGFAAGVLVLTFEGRLSFEVFALMHVLFAGAWIMGNERRTRRNQSSLVEDRAARLERELGHLAREAVADERARITQELHETVIANLSMMVAQAKVAERALPVQAAPPRDAIDFIRKTGEQTLAELRRTAEVLRPDEPVVIPPSPAGLSQLGALVTEVKMAGLPVDVVVEGDARPLPAEVDGSAYRIVQEALTICLKHAGPARPRLLIRYGAEQLELEVTEDIGGAWRVDPEGGRRENLGWMQQRASSAGTAPLVEGTYGVRARLPI